MLSRIRKFIYKNTSKEQDYFIKRLRSLVIGEGMLNAGNIELIEYAIQNMPAKGSVIEIGSYGGLSTNLIAYLLKKHNRNNVFFNCDAWIYEGYDDYKGEQELSIDGRHDILRSTYSNYMKTAFINSTIFLSADRLPHSFHMRSAEFFQKWNTNQLQTDLFGNESQLGGPVSFAYIDGGHSFEVAWADFTNVVNNMPINGFILLDDSADHLNFGSAKMIRDIKKDNRFKIVDKNPNYLIQKIS